ncbi:hypothetical protein HAX54_040962, partial [Datura stramonium]|nr:hypothetical protein [Datura stramonium]
MVSAWKWQREVEKPQLSGRYLERSLIQKRTIRTWQKKESRAVRCQTLALRAAGKGNETRDTPLVKHKEARDALALPFLRVHAAEEEGIEEGLQMKETE